MPIAGAVALSAAGVFGANEDARRMAISLRASAHDLDAEHRISERHVQAGPQRQVHLGSARGDVFGCIFSIGGPPGAGEPGR